MSLRLEVYALLLHSHCRSDLRAQLSPNATCSLFTLLKKKTFHCIMSGLEVVGVAASLIQIADVGAKLSIKLFSFCRHAKNISQSMQSLSSEVALTCTILRELGEVLSEDESSKLCSNEAFRTAQQVLNECRKVLQQLQRMTNDADHSTNSRFRRATGALRNVLLIEPNVDPLKQSLERLKSTILLLLNVIMYAGQVRL